MCWLHGVMVVNVAWRTGRMMLAGKEPKCWKKNPVLMPLRQPRTAQKDIQRPMRNFRLPPRGGNCALLGYYVASSGNFLPTFRDNLSNHLQQPYRLTPYQWDIFTAHTLPSIYSVFGLQAFFWIPQPWGWDRKVAHKCRYEITSTRRVITQKNKVLIQWPKSDIASIAGDVFRYKII